MSITAPVNPNAFRTTPAKGLAEGQRVDRENNVIYGAALMQLGELSEGDSRPWFVDEETLSQVLSFGKKSKLGFKARFTHPGLSNDGLGSYLGRWKNFKRDGDTVRADLHIAEAAFTSPEGDLGTYVMDMADEDPEAFGVSLAGSLDFKEMKKGTREKDEFQPIRFAALRAADVVDTPAATHGGFFSADFSTDDPARLPANVSQLLDTFFPEAEPDVIRGRFEGFLQKYFAMKGRPMSEVTKPAELQEEKKTEPVVEKKPEIKPAELSADQIKDAEETRVKQVKALCALSGIEGDAVTQLVDSGMSRAEVQNFLSESGQLEKARPLIAGTGAGDTNQKPKDKDPNDKFKEEFAAGPHLFGITEEEYVFSRRVETGLEPLQPSFK